MTLRDARAGKTALTCILGSSCGRDARALHQACTARQPQACCINPRKLSCCEKRGCERACRGTAEADCRRRGAHAQTLISSTSTVDHIKMSGNTSNRRGNCFTVTM